MARSIGSLAAFGLATLSAAAMAAPSQVVAQAPKPSAVAGRWSGSMTAMGQQVPLVVELSPEGDSLRGTLEVQGRTGLPLVAVELDGATIRFERRASTGTLAFVGTVRGDSLTGTFRQAGVEGPFALAREVSGDPTGSEAPGATAPPPPVGDGTGRLSPCRPPGLSADVLCGTFRVPEDRGAPGGRTLDLNIVVLPAAGEKADSVPVVLLAGGPGGAATESAFAVGILFPDMRRDFDVILVDRRGTGDSNPLQCEYRDINELARAVLQVDFDEGRLASCRTGLDADLTQYTTPLAMDDLADVLGALGHARVNVYGMSYGTRAALVLARRHPELIRTLTLQGVAPLSLRLPMDVPRDAQASLDGVFRDCSRDPECAAAYPDLEGKLAGALERLDREPAVVEVTDPITRGSGSWRITADVFTGGLRSLLYASAFIQAIPRVVDAAYDGDLEPFAQASLPLVVSFGRTLYMGLYLSVVCSEDVPFIDEDEARVRAAGTFLGDRMLRHHRASCLHWPRAELPEGFSDPVHSPVPTLLISGTSDPVTPPHWAQEAALDLPNSLQIVVPRAGHADSVGPCEQAIIARFMASGSTSDLDLGCVAAGRTRVYAPSGG